MSTQIPFKAEKRYAWFKLLTLESSLHYLLNVVCWSWTLASRFSFLANHFPSKVKTGAFVSDLKKIGFSFMVVGFDNHCSKRSWKIFWGRNGENSCHQMTLLSKSFARKVCGLLVKGFGFTWSSKAVFEIVFLVWFQILKSKQWFHLYYSISVLQMSLSMLNSDWVCLNLS